MAASKGRARRSAFLGFLLMLFLLALAPLITVESHWRDALSQRISHSAAAIPHRVARQPQAKRAVEYLLEYDSHEAADYPQECRERYHGLPFYQTINNSWQQPVCMPQAGSQLQTSISCWFQFDKYAEAYCTGTNLALDLAKFAEEDASLPSVASNRDDSHLFVSHPRPGIMGELLGDCQLHGTVNGEHKWKEDSFGKGGQKWLFHSFKSTVGEPQQPQCVAWIDHPLYFLNDKYDSVNVWHALEDVTHAFEAWALKGWGRDAQVVVLDQVSVESVLGPTYLPVWQKVFSSQNPPVLLRQLVADTVAAHQGTLPPGAALCFKDIFFGVHGGISILSRSIASWTPCKNSTVIQALVNFMMDGLQLTDVRPASHNRHRQQQQQQQRDGRNNMPSHDLANSQSRMRVVWALRSNRAGQQQEVLDALQRRLPEELGAEVVAVDFGGLSIEEQIRRVRQTDVLVGYHGAALTLAVYMNWQSGLVEIEESFRCTCYTNCALWRDHPYSLIRAPEFPDGTALANKVVQEVKAMLTSVEARIKAHPL